MTEKDISDLAFEWSIDYKPWEDNLPPQEYARYGFEQGYRRALESMGAKPPTKGPRPKGKRENTMSIEISELDADDLQKIVEGVISVLYRDPDTGELDPDLEWDSDTPDGIVEVLKAYGIVPGQEPEDEELTMTPDEAISWLDGLADDEDDEMGRECRAIAKMVKTLRDTAQEVCSESDETGCDVGLTVTSFNAIARLNNVVNPDFIINEVLDDENFNEDANDNA